MKVVRVTYTVQAGFSGQNQANIRAVMDDLQQANHPGINYYTCMEADGKTFSHNAFFQSDEDEQLLFALPSFKNFREQLKQSEPEINPKQELLTLVGTSKPIF